MQRVSALAEMEAEFMHRVRTMVYCSAATVDRHGRPRSRVIHPVWDAMTGWFTTELRTAKAKHLAANPHISLAYIADPFKPLYVECRAVFLNDPATRQQVWDLYKTIPEPLGSDLALTWGHVDNPVYSVVRLDPWRIELYDLFTPANRRVWLAEGEA